MWIKPDVTLVRVGYSMLTGKVTVRIVRNNETSKGYDVTRTSLHRINRLISDGKLGMVSILHLISGSYLAEYAPVWSILL